MERDNYWSSNEKYHFRRCIELLVVSLKKKNIRIQLTYLMIRRFDLIEIALCPSPLLFLYSSLRFIHCVRNLTLKTFINSAHNSFSESFRLLVFLAFRNWLTHNSKQFNSYLTNHVTIKEYSCCCCCCIYSITWKWSNFA